jgi:hypothetical protein
VTEKALTENSFRAGGGGSSKSRKGRNTEVTRELSDTQILQLTEYLKT